LNILSRSDGEFQLDAHVRSFLKEATQRARRVGDGVFAADIPTVRLDTG
jgi:hypothetical protein